MSDVTDEMTAEFDTVATWTAAAAAGLAATIRIPAGCRGSGTPVSMRWLLEHLDPRPGQLFLDCGAGVGGPAAFAAQETGVRPLLTDPELGACRAARSLFDLPALQADSRLPIATGAITSGWSLGVLCTVPNQPAWLAEIRRVLHPQGRFGLLIYCAAHPGDLRLRQPEGNAFPTPPALDRMVDQASLRVVTSGWLEDFPGPPADWQDAADIVQAELQRRHSNDPRWQTAQHQAHQMGALLTAGEVCGRLLVVQPT